jgi:hypothetical protein
VESETTSLGEFQDGAEAHFMESWNEEAFFVTREDELSCGGGMEERGIIGLPLNDDPGRYLIINHMSARIKCLFLWT